MPYSEPIVDSCRLCIFNVDEGLLVLHFFWEWEIGDAVDFLISCNDELKLCDTVHCPSASFAGEQFQCFQYVLQSSVQKF